MAWTSAKTSANITSANIFSHQQLWVPDLFFLNEKVAKFHEVTVDNKLLHILHNGSVFYSARISLVLKCQMNLIKFPFDTQICHINMASYSFTTDNIVFVWHEEPIVLRHNFVLQQFDLEDMKTSVCTDNFRSIDGLYSCIRSDFKFARRYGYYMAQIYLPSTLVVILSWVSFYLDIDAVPARISLGLLTVLTMTTQSATANSHLPPVSYIKAIDVWMAMCLFFVFAALIEYAFVNAFARDERKRLLRTVKRLNLSHSQLTHSLEEASERLVPSRGVSTRNVPMNVSGRASPIARPVRPSHRPSSSSVDRSRGGLAKMASDRSSPVDTPTWLRRSFLNATNPNTSRIYLADLRRKIQAAARRASIINQEDDNILADKISKSRRKASRLDRFSRVAFPLTFGVFNISYWSFYMTWEADTDTTYFLSRQWQ